MSYSITTTSEQISKFKSQLKNAPKYPVICASPTFTMTMLNMNTSDVALLTAFTLSGAPVGWLFAAPLRIPTMKCAMVIGAVGGITYAMQRSYQRLSGYLPNSSEVSKYSFRLDDNGIQKIPVRRDPIPQSILNQRSL
eukprot:TRINITY_DN1164_c0_g1_i1.p1 TRINITY_DN1164_c0_g1~~TRINITY_DN1164_c0_g1_i1.p1  ORF type:complete len:138 (-),score=34.30 TRINITY_DN1164_c0_g1_i1:81-494(-)